MEGMRTTVTLSLSLVSALALGCATSGEDGNPFLEDQSNPGKEDTAYLNPDGIEVEVDLEADVVASAYKLPDAPATLGQFAMTYFRERGTFYLESLAEDASSDTRVEWLVDGSWITAAAARSVPQDKLTHWRLRGINAVLLLGASDGAAVGKTWTAKVPLKPIDVYAEAGDTCGEAGGHIELSQSTYWYVWNPDKAGCKATLQDMKVTLSRMLPSGKFEQSYLDEIAPSLSVGVGLAMRKLERR